MKGRNFRKLYVFLERSLVDLSSSIHRSASTQGVYFSICPPPPAPPKGGAKIWSIGCLGKKYDDLLRKNVNISGKRWKNRGKEKIFTVPEEEHINLERGGGQNIPIWPNIQPCKFYGAVYFVKFKKFKK